MHFLLGLRGYWALFSLLHLKDDCTLNYDKTGSNECVIYFVLKLPGEDNMSGITSYAHTQFQTKKINYEKNSVCRYISIVLLNFK